MHIVWDWNGTLLDDREAVLDGLAAAAFRQTGRVQSRTRVRDRLRPSLRATFDALVDDVIDDGDWSEARAVVVAEVAARAALVPEATAVIDRLARAGWTHSLLSRWPHASLVDNVRAFGLAARFRLVEGAAAAHHDAKSDRIVQHLAAVAAVLAVEERDLGRVVLVGDSITDAAVAARAAIPAFICPSHSLQPESRDDLRLLGACVFERLADLPALLEEET